MKLPFSLFLALRYFRPKRTFLSVVTVLSVLGVLLGVAVLVVVISVMTGFDNMWRDKILSFNAHVTVTGFGTIEGDEAWLAEIRKTPGVTGVAPFVQGLIFLNRNDTVYSPFVRGIDPERERAVSQIPAHIGAGKFSVEDNEIVIGGDLARRMGVHVGDKVLAYSPQSFAKADELRLPDELEVAGTFDLGMYDLDMGYVLCSLAQARALFGLKKGIHGVAVMTADPFSAPRVAQQLRETLGPNFEVRTWMEMNRQLFGALRAEKNMMFFLLIFITIVAAFGITNTLITVTVQKTREIGLLKAIGFQSGGIMGVFFWQGWVAGVLGTAAGIGTGLLALHYRNDLLRFLNDRVHLELLPKELYQLSEIPASTQPRDLVLIAVAVLVICTLAGVIPALRAARLDPARALRYE